MSNYFSAGKRVLVIANHPSYLDGLLLALFLPESPLFAVNRQIATRWYFRPFLARADIVLLDASAPAAVREMVRQLRSDRMCMIFPEGRVTTTGSLMKIYAGPALIAEKAGAVLLPVRIDGPQFTPLSQLLGMVRKQWFPKITLTLFPPRQLDIPTAISGRSRQKLARRNMFDILADTLSVDLDEHRGIPVNLWHLCSQTGWSRIAIEDTDGRCWRYDDLIQVIRDFAVQLSPAVGEGEQVAVPAMSSVRSVALIFALMITRRVPVIVDEHVSTQIVNGDRWSGCSWIAVPSGSSAIGGAEDSGEPVPAPDWRLHSGGNVLELRSALRAPGNGWSWINCAACCRRWYYRHASRVHADDRAVRFVARSQSGSRVSAHFTHRQLQLDVQRFLASQDLRAREKVFNAVGISTWVGFVLGTLLPLLRGLTVVFSDSRIPARRQPELVYDSNATVIVGDAGTLEAMVSGADPYDFHAVRRVYCGPFSDEELRETWLRQFALRLLEVNCPTPLEPFERAESVLRP